MSEAPDSEAPADAPAEAAAGVPESIIVGVRVKPPPDSASAVHVIVDKEAGRVCVSPGVNERAFQFDHAYAADSTQQQIYEELGAPILRKALQGFNGTIFAYGQTGSGKTHTMSGDGTDEGAGIVPRLGEELFFVVDQALSEDPDRKFLLTASYLEIYNECLHDLLRPAPRRSGSGARRDAGPAASGSEPLEIKEHPSLGVHVKGLVEMPVRDRRQLARLMSDGNARRATGETLMNARSSRSHAVFSLRVTQQEAVAGTDGKERRERWSKINLVDLAGSERASKSGAEGGRLKEGIAINVSLSALGNVIIALASAGKGGKRPHVPYRNSKLTRVLQESLGGNSLTVMVATVSGEAQHMDETLSTLAYADRAKSIIVRAHKNEQISEVGKLKSEVDLLRRKLADAAGTASSEEERAQLQIYRSQVEAYEARLAVSFEQTAAVAAQLAAATEAARLDVSEYHASRRAALRSLFGPWLPLLWADNRAWAEGFLPKMAAVQAEIRAVEDASARCHSMLAVLAQAVQDGTGALDAAAGGHGAAGPALDLGASIDLHHLLGAAGPGVAAGFLCGEAGKPAVGENLTHALGLDDTGTLHTLRLQGARLASLAAQAAQAEELLARRAGLWGQVREALAKERARHALSSPGTVEMTELEEAAKDMQAVEEVAEVAVCTLKPRGAKGSGVPPSSGVHGRRDASPIQAYTGACAAFAGQNDPDDARVFGEDMVGGCAGRLASSLVDLLQAEARRLRAERADAAVRDGGACDRRVEEAEAAAAAISSLRVVGGEPMGGGCGCSGAGGGDGAGGSGDGSAAGALASAACVPAKGLPALIGALQRGLRAAERCVSYRLVLRKSQQQQAAGSEGVAGGVVANGVPVPAMAAGGNESAEVVAREAAAREALLREQLVSYRKQNEQLLSVVSCQATTIEQVTSGSGSAAGRELAQQRQLASQAVRMAELQAELDQARQGTRAADSSGVGSGRSEPSLDASGEGTLALEREMRAQQAVALRLAGASLSATQSETKVLATQASVAESRAAEASGLADALRVELAEAQAALEAQAVELEQARAFETAWADLASQMGCVDAQGQLMRERMEALSVQLVESRDREAESSRWLAQVKEMMASGKEDGLAMALCQNMHESRAKDEALAAAKRQVAALMKQLGRAPSSRELAGGSSGGGQGSVGGTGRGSGSIAGSVDAVSAASAARGVPPPKAMLSDRTLARLESHGIGAGTRGAAGGTTAGWGGGGAAIRRVGAAPDAADPPTSAFAFSGRRAAARAAVARR